MSTAFLRSCGATNPQVIGRCGRDADHDGPHRSTGETFEASWIDTPPPAPVFMPESRLCNECPPGPVIRNHPANDPDCPICSPPPPERYAPLPDPVVPSS